MGSRRLEKISHGVVGAEWLPARGKMEFWIAARGSAVFKGGTGLTNMSYGYAMGRIKTIENKMLTKNQLDRMIDSRTVDDAMRILAEADYGYSGGDAEAFRDYEKLLDDEYAKLINLIRDISPEPALVNVFLIKNDYHNVKVLLKGEFSKGKNEDGSIDETILSENGLIPLHLLKRAMLERKYSDIPPIMASGIERTIEAFNRTSDPQVIDITLDIALFTQMLSEAEALDNSFLTGLVRSYIDIANIGAFIRVKAMGKTWEFLRDALLYGGYIDHDVYYEAMQNSIDSFTDALCATRYDSLCEEGIKSFQSTGSLTVFERNADDYINSYIGKSKLMSAGIEIIIAYLVAKQSEIKNVRVIIVGKKNNIPGEIIRERLRETYV